MFVPKPSAETRTSDFCNTLDDFYETWILKFRPRQWESKAEEKKPERKWDQKEKDKENRKAGLVLGTTLNIKFFDISDDLVHHIDSLTTKGFQKIRYASRFPKYTKLSDQAVTISAKQSMKMSESHRW